MSGGDSDLSRRRTMFALRSASAMNAGNASSFELSGEISQTA
jgi:hypothetical protein